MALEEFNHFFKDNDYYQESKLSSSKRNDLDDSDFALVYTDENGKKIRKYPIHDEAHVKAAAKMFPRGVPLKYKKKVAHKILRKAHEFDIDTSGWNSVNSYQESFIDEQLNDLEWYDESVKEEYQKMTEGKSTLNKILFALPRLILALLRNATKKFDVPTYVPKEFKPKKNVLTPILLTAGGLIFTGIAVENLTPNGNLKEKVINFIDIPGNAKIILNKIEADKIAKETKASLIKFKQLKNPEISFTVSTDNSNPIVVVHRPGYSLAEFFENWYKLNTEFIINLINKFNEIISKIPKNASSPAAIANNELRKANDTLLKKYLDDLIPLIDKLNKSFNEIDKNEKYDMESIKDIENTINTESVKHKNAVEKTINQLKDLGKKETIVTLDNKSDAMNEELNKVVSNQLQKYFERVTFVSSLFTEFRELIKSSVKKYNDKMTKEKTDEEKLQDARDWCTKEYVKRIKPISGKATKTQQDEIKDQVIAEYNKNNGTNFVRKDKLFQKGSHKGVYTEYYTFDF